MTMELIDTHTHLYLPEFDADNDDTLTDDSVTRAVKAGVTHMIFPNVDLTTIRPMHDLAARHHHTVSMAMGLHPTSVGDGWKDDLAQISDIIADGSDYVAIGEVGIDLYWDKTYRDVQMQVFEKQAQFATGLGLPLIIHCREGLSEALEVLQGVNGVSGVFHSFGGNATDVDAVRRVGDFYFGINGIVTFKNSDLSRHIPAIGLERILLETDSPYLTPVPFRGKRNESAYLPYVADKIADILGRPVSEIAENTAANTRRLFLSLNGI